MTNAIWRVCLKDNMSKLGSLVRERSLILDGAMGTMIQPVSYTHLFVKAYFNRSSTEVSSLQASWEWAAACRSPPEVFAWREETSVEERLKYALTKGIGDYLEEDLAEALKLYPKEMCIRDRYSY